MTAFEKLKLKCSGEELSAIEELESENQSLREGVRNEQRKFEGFWKTHVKQLYRNTTKLTEKEISDKVEREWKELTKEQ